MFLVIPLVEFLHVLGVDINVHHENPATFLCHVSVSSVKRSRHRFASSRWHPGPHAWSPGETRDTNWGAILVDIPQIPGLLSAIFRLIEAHRNEIQAQPASFAANRSGCSARCAWIGISCCSGPVVTSVLKDSVVMPPLVGLLSPHSRKKSYRSSLGC